MAETIPYNVTPGIWHNVSGTIKRGIFTNNSEQYIRYVIATNQPTDNGVFGHVANPNEERSFTLMSDEKLWAYSFFPGTKIAITENHTIADLVNALIEYKNGPGLDSSGRLRVSEPFGVMDNKNITGRNRSSWNEVLAGVILEYTGLTGGPFTIGEEIRGTGGLLPTATVDVDSGTALTVHCEHHDFTVGMVVTGQTSGATATLTSVDTGSYISHDQDKASVDLQVGTANGDYTIRQTVRRAAYVPFKSQFPTLTFQMAAAKLNVVQRVGLFNTTDGLFIEQNSTTDVAFVLRSSTSGSPVDTRISQDTWNIDRLDGGVSGGPNPSGITLDLSKCQLVAITYTWQGVGPVYLGFDIDNKIIHCHEIKTSNFADGPYMRTPSLPLRYEIRNIGATASPTVLQEICSTVSSEGGYQPPGFEYSSSLGITARTIDSTTLYPILAIRLKNTLHGVSNERMAQFLKLGILVKTNDIYFELRHIHTPIDITATWQSADEESGVEYSTDITAITGRPSHLVESDYAPTGAANKFARAGADTQFINNHTYIGQNFDHTNSECFVLYAQSLTGSADVLASITWIEFD